MTVKEFCELKLKEYPDGIWVGVHYPSGLFDDEIYLDEYYMTEFAGILDQEVTKWYLDDCDYEILEIWIK